MARAPRNAPRTRRTPRVAAALLAAAGALAAGCDALPGTGPAGPTAAPAPSAPQNAPGAGPPASEEIEQALSDLSEAEVGAEGSGAGYEREEFGSSWIDTDDNGCPTRHDILARDLRAARVADDCTVTRGVLEDPYTGERIDFSAEDPMEVQIDHLVPLALAWRTGAGEWDRDTRVEFANDRDNLIAADGPANQSKGDSGPGEWQPYPPFRCAYAVAYVDVVDAYGLRLPSADRAALEEMLANC
ncbi:HNH endonuclease family protein [Streptomonospora wellingtoniae]|uniref:HNH endonuclease family protein n=1 Tax=Streptomonospora wellingtoniae TaxID=3075544 RepID=A0ABU2L0M3_9ACTN|nr:HNH endonuclease family protein [Streptomonospora sp. DSM 45055]MDT0305106.1 HNH endonuclease family protein [Streptomonospora sp. DSM 45055]